MEGNIVEQRKKEFASFLQQAYAAYVHQQSKRGTNIPSQTDFANFLGVTQTSFSNYINGNRPPSESSLDKMAEKLGPRVYEIWGVPPRMPSSPEAQKIFRNFHKLTPQQRKQLAEMAANMADGNEESPSNDEEGGIHFSTAGI